MPVGPRLAAVSLLLCSACGVEAPSADTAVFSPAPFSPVHPTDWAATVSQRIAAEGRAFHQRESGFGAELPALGLRVDVVGDAVRVAGAAGERFRLRTAAWGRADELHEPALGEAGLGACSAQTGATGQCVQRLERPGAGLTEWWVGLETGVEQGWTVETSPWGDGPLVVDVAADGALGLEVSQGEGVIWDTIGAAWRVSGVVAWDATGRPLPSLLVPGPNGLRVEVDDAEAVYPVEVDPVYTSAASTWTGEGASSYLGGSVSSAGDVNGDGFDDVVVGAMAYNGSTGRVYSYHGSSSGLGTSAARTLTGDIGNGQFGSSVSGAGDVNGDGFDDVIVGARLHTAQTGRAYVYYGSAVGLSASPAVTWAGEGADSWFGASVSGAGDVNGDGFDDVVVGAQLHGSATGRAYLFRGGSAGISTIPVISWTGEGINNRFGASVAGVGDVNGDGFDDVAVGAYEINTYRGKVYLYYGGPAGLPAIASTTRTGEAPNSHFGGSVAGAGDVNGDGFADVVIAASWYNANRGRVYVYHGASAGLSASASTTWNGAVGIQYYGDAVSGAGDVNGDGFDDVVVGASWFSSLTGQVYLYHGGAVGMDTSPASTLTGDSTLSHFGWSVSGAGDVNGDGYADIVVGAPARASNTGRAYVFLGYVDEDGDGVPGSEDCDDNDASVRRPVTRFMDADRDGFGSTATGEACPGAVGFSDVDTDCDDSRSGVRPDAIEVCNGQDDDCDGLGDDADPSISPASQLTWYVDADRDGFGDPDTTVLACIRPLEYVSVAGDCDDAVAAVNPDAAEVCNEVDDDCDTLLDDADPSIDPSTQLTWYADADADGFGDAASAVLACVAPTGHGSNAEDCDDAAAAVNPASTEVCNEVDDDCDGAVDELPDCVGPGDTDDTGDSDDVVDTDDAVDTDDLVDTDDTDDVVDTDDTDDVVDTDEPVDTGFTELNGRLAGGAGCECRVAAGSGSSGAPWALLLVGAALARRRRGAGVAG